MRRVALIYNPVAGGRREGRAARVVEAAAVFERAGVRTDVIPTESAESTGPQAQRAIADGCDAVIACGGDGTVHDVLQSVAGGTAALGVIPMGTANALARDLGIPGSVTKAAKMLLEAAPVRVPLGRVFFRGLEEDGSSELRSRYFIVAAGIGADGLFFSRIDSRMKERFGYVHYAVEALRLAAVHTFPVFAASFLETGGARRRTEEVSQVLAVRISDFGGLVRNLVPGAAIQNENLHVIAFKTRSRLRYFHFMATVWFRRHRYTSTIEAVDCVDVECRELEGSTERLYVEADGELLGTLPVRMEVAPEAVTVLIPRRRGLARAL